MDRTAGPRSYNAAMAEGIEYGPLAEDADRSARGGVVDLRAGGVRGAGDGGGSGAGKAPAGQGDRARADARGALKGGSALGGCVHRLLSRAARGGRLAYVVHGLRSRATR